VAFGILNKHIITGFWIAYLVTLFNIEGELHSKFGVNADNLKQFPITNDFIQRKERFLIEKVSAVPFHIFYAILFETIQPNNFK
jgi:hypothetical protein